VRVVDNATYPPTAALRAWFAAHRERIRPRWFPTYRPQRNRIERVGRFLKPPLAGHHYGNDRDGLATAAQPLGERIRATCAAPPFPHITIGQDFCEPA